MKKILFLLVALVCSINMNAQIVKFMKGNTVVAKYTVKEVDNIVIEESSKTGIAKRTGDIDVVWVQLWKDGPKFAEYNVGAANNKAEDCGGFYCWGKSIDKDSEEDYKKGTDALTGTDDTATNLWGSNWRMPTEKEFEALVANCDFEWTTVNDVNGCKFTGKNAYSSHSIFLPAAGYYSLHFNDLGKKGYYWTSTPDAKINFNAHFLLSDSEDSYVASFGRSSSYSVRAVLNE